MTARLIELAGRSTVLDTPVTFHEQSILTVTAGLVELARGSTVGDAPVAFHEQGVFALASRLVELARWSARSQATVPVRCWRRGGAGDGGSDPCGG